MSSVTQFAHSDQAGYHTILGAPKPPPWNRLRHLGAACLALGLSGCSAALQKWTDNSGFLVAAEPLCEDTPGSQITSDGTCTGAGQPASQPVSAAPTMSATTTPPVVPVPPASPAFPNKTYIGLLLNESENNCGKFVNGLVLISNSTNTTLDGLTTVFTALGTAFTPIGVVHGLTAAGSISSGWKTAIDTDVYAKQTIANYALAIQTGYYTDLQGYITDLGKVTDDSSIILPIEVAKIRTIHRECSLATAQASLSSTIGPTTTGAAGATPPALTGGAAAPAPPPAGAQPQAAQPQALVATPPAATGAVTTRSVVPGHPLR